MKYSLAVVAGLVLASFVYSSREAQAQSKEVQAIQSLQREIYDLRRAIDASKEGDAEKLAQLDALIRQAVDSTHALSGDLQQMQKNIMTGMSEQQTKAAAPIVMLRTSIEQIAQDTAAVRNSLDSFGSRITRMESQITELSQLVRTLNVAPPAPPPVTGSFDSAEALLVAAMRDWSSGKDDLALKGFGEFATQHPDHPEAPKALYYMGLSYDRLGDFENAVKAFDSVVERYGETGNTLDARWGKANALLKAGRKDEARREFVSFIESYPTTPQAATARDRLRELGTP